MPASLPSLKTLAEQTAAKAGVSGRVPVYLERIAEELRFVPMGFRGEGNVADVPGAIDMEGDNRVLYVNVSDALGVQRFTLAHLIGHVVLDTAVSGVEIRANFDSPGDPKEIEANNFALELLMPEAEFLDALNASRFNRKRMAARFGVTTEAVGRRIEKLGFGSR